VDLFFVLSGFLIGSILLRHRDDPHFFLTFYGRRIWRILPLYFSFLLGCCLLQFSWPWSWMSDLAPIFTPSLPAATFATFTQNFAMAANGRFANAALNVTWSLAIEEQFYLLLPPLVRFVPVQRLPVVLIGLIGAGFTGRNLLLAIQPEGAGLAAYVLLPFRWDPLLLGVLVAWMFQDTQWKGRMIQARRSLRFIFAISATCMLWLAMSARGVIMASSVTSWGYTLVALFYASGLVLILSGGMPWLTGLLRGRSLVWLGTVSYGVYLFHEGINSACHRLLMHAEPRFVTAGEMGATGLSILLTLSLAAASWKWFEKPIVDRSHRKFLYERVGSREPRLVPTPTDSA
jgi:peptidoglycan/LPS O-acetylase OafA/YrhL